MAVKYYRWAGEQDEFAIYGYSSTMPGAFTKVFKSPQIFVEVDCSVHAPEYMKDGSVVFLRPLAVPDMACPFCALTDFEQISEDEIPIYTMITGEVKNETG